MCMSIFTIGYYFYIKSHAIATDDRGHTSIPGVFASGDVVKGARTVVEAVAYSKIVAEAMDEYMQTIK